MITKSSYKNYSDMDILEKGFIFYNPKLNRHELHYDKNNHAVRYVAIKINDNGWVLKAGTELHQNFKYVKIEGKILSFDIVKYIVNTTKEVYDLYIG